MSSPVSDRALSWRDHHAQLMQSVHILVVDDEPVICATLEALFGDEGFTVDTLHTAEAAWARIASMRYDLLITDKNLPGMSGVDLLEKVHGAGIDLPSVMITGYGSSATVSQALKNGAADYITKPFDDIDHLVGRVRRVIDRRLSTLLYAQIVDALKSSMAAGGLKPDARFALKHSLFSFRTRLYARPHVVVLEADDGLRTAILRTLQAGGFQTEAVANPNELIQRFEGKADTPLAALLPVAACDAQLLDSLKTVDPRLELLAFGQQTTRLQAALAVVSNGVGDFVILGEEGPNVLKARVSQAVDRGRRRCLNLNLVSTLWQLAQKSGDTNWDDLLERLPPSDRQIIESTRLEHPEPVESDVELLELVSTVRRNERRYHPRFAWRCPVVLQYTLDGRPIVQRTQTVDVSHGGMFIEGDPPPMGTNLLVSVAPRPGQESAVAGRVVRVVENPYGFGVEFLRSDEQIAQILGARQKR